MKKISVYGAGLAGMVAAINLNRAGMEVTVHEREKGVGGSGDVHPSVHTTPLQPERTWEYIGIDLSDCFLQTGEHPAWWYNAKRLTLPAYVGNLKSYSVERGSRETSIDNKLYNIAVKEGVKFQFNSGLDARGLSTVPPGSIIATGLYKEVYQTAGMDYRTLYGSLASRPVDSRESTVDVYLGSFSVDYGYVSAVNGLAFALLFSRKPLSGRDLGRFKAVIRKTRGFEFAEWSPFLGHFPREARLYWNDRVLAGTISGMIEPFWGYGIVGALLSGKVASLALTDRAQAEADFAGFTRGFESKLARKERLDRMPFSKALLRLGILKARLECALNPSLKNAVKEPVRWFR